MDKLRHASFLVLLLLLLNPMVACPGPALEAGEMPDSSAAARGVSVAQPGDAAGWLERGHALRKQGDLKGAEKAFRKALSSGDRRRKAEAYNGLGLVYGTRPSGLQDAVYYFQQALSMDPGYVEAQCNKAQVYYDRGWIPHAIQEANGTLGMDSTYGPARRLLSQCRVRQAEGSSNPRERLEKALRSEPEDSAGWMAWAKLSLSEGNDGAILDRMVPVARSHPGWRDMLPVVAQALWHQNRVQKAWDVFRGYLDGLDPREQSVYDDLRPVCSREEAEAYGGASVEGRRGMAARFWSERDPDLTTPVNERLLEHYRRVWFSRTYFSKDRYPYDRRGEVYIRYGEPDHRSRSGGQNALPTVAVNAVKERVVNQLYDVMRPSQTLGAPGTVNSRGVRIDRTQLFDAVTAAVMGGSLVGPAYPIRSYYPDTTEHNTGIVYLPVGSSDFSQVPWESWVYASIAGGVEIDFTDEIGRGGFDYAPIPDLDKTRGLRNVNQDAIKALGTLKELSPEAVANRAVARTPERYGLPSGTRTFGFHYDAATFRGTADSTAVEVYYGFPMSKAAYFEGDRKTGLRVVCRAALAAMGGDRVYRAENEMTYVESGDLTRTPGFIPHLARLEVPPGEYRMDVRVENRLNGEVGHYRKVLAVRSYPAQPLMLSDLELAGAISEPATGDRFSKQGLQVIPMPTRHYGKGQPVWLYYEIYNLRRDESGKASYTVEYAVRSGKTSGLVSQVLRSFLGRERSPEVSVRQERLGLGETEIQHIQMDLGNLSPGEFTVRVTVKDVLTGQEASKEASFTVEGQEGTQRR